MFLIFLNYKKVGNGWKVINWGFFLEGEREGIGLYANRDWKVLPIWIIEEKLDLLMSLSSFEGDSTVGLDGEIRVEVIRGVYRRHGRFSPLYLQYIVYNIKGANVKIFITCPPHIPSLLPAHA